MGNLFDDISRGDVSTLTTIGLIVIVIGAVLAWKFWPRDKPVDHLAPPEQINPAPPKQDDKGGEGDEDDDEDKNKINHRVQLMVDKTVLETWEVNDYDLITAGIVLKLPGDNWITLIKAAQQHILINEID